MKTLSMVAILFISMSLISAESEPGRRGRQFSNILDEIKLENSYRNAAFESLINRTLSFKKSNLDHLKVENIPEDDSMTSFLSFFGKKKKREAQFNQVYAPGSYSTNINNVGGYGGYGGYGGLGKKKREAAADFLPIVVKREAQNYYLGYGFDYGAANYNQNNGYGNHATHYGRK